MIRCTECFTETADVFNVCPVCGSSVGCPASNGGNPLEGKLLYGRYFIGKTAGRGGFGILYRAFDTLLSRVVAVKEFFPEKLACRGADGVTVLPLGPRGPYEFGIRKKQFSREAMVVSGLDGCRFFPQFYDCFEENSTSYIVMDYLDGKPLSSFFENGCADATYVAAAVSQAALGISSLHASGIVHRDISPENIMICPAHGGDEIKIIDFGAAIKECDNNSKYDIILKKGYSAPEQYGRGGGTKQSDVYSLGATLLSLIIGRRPSEEDFVRLKDRDGDIPCRRKLRNIISRATDSDPGKRYRDAGAFYKALKKAM